MTGDPLLWVVAVLILSLAANHLADNRKARRSEREMLKRSARGTAHE